MNGPYPTLFVFILAGCSPEIPEAVYSITLVSHDALSGETVTAGQNQAAPGSNVTITAVLRANRQVVLGAAGMIFTHDIIVAKRNSDGCIRKSSLTLYERIGFEIQDKSMILNLYWLI